MGTVYTNEFVEVIRKSELLIKTEDDYNDLQKEREQFLNCSLVDEKESVKFLYDIEEKIPFTNIRREKRIDCLRALMEVRKLEKYYKELNFQIRPDNLYYDRNFRIYVRRRDAFESGISGELENMAEQYRALVAYVLQGKYEYDDYFLGGSDLYKKNKYIKKLVSAKDNKAILEWVENAYKQEWENVFHKKVEVNKNWYYFDKWYKAITIAMIIIAGSFILYATGELIPRKNAMIQAQNSFLDAKYVQVIDDLKNVDMKYMDKYLKYILAISYVKGENLTPEQKDNILDTITIDGEEKQKDYWIYLGRLNTTEAQNIAMQRGDDELLLYAYMTEKAILEKNTEISGEEKVAQLDTLEKKIEELAEKYTPEETE